MSFIQYIAIRRHMLLGSFGGHVSSQSNSEILNYACTMSHKAKPATKQNPLTKVLQPVDYSDVDTVVAHFEADSSQAQSENDDDQQFGPYAATRAHGQISFCWMHALFTFLCCAVSTDIIVIL